MTNNKSLISTYGNQLGSLYRLIDALIIAITLYALFQLENLVFTTEQERWLLIAIPSFHFFAEFSNVYRIRRGEGNNKKFVDILVAWFLVINVFLLINYFHPIVEEFHRDVFWFWLGAVPIEIISWHLILQAIANELRIRGSNIQNVAIIGVTELGKEIEQALSNDVSLGMRFVGYYDDRALNQAENRIKINKKQLKGNCAKLFQHANAGLVDIVYISLPMKADKRIKDIVDMLADSTLTVYFIPDLFICDLMKSHWTTLHGMPVVSIYDTPFQGVDGLLKRIFDIVVGSLILSLILIPMVFIAIAVKLTSKGPVLFKQRRYGFKGEEVYIWKFRSMSVAEDGANVQQATKNDPRVTKLGGFLRKTSLDELPQFFNVLQGRMSIVGPRPHAVAHNEYYRGQIKGYMLRHKVKPGITGLAQISGFRGETDTLDKMQGRVKYDLEYIRTWSIFLDIKIIFLTIFKGFRGSHVY